VKTVKAYIVKVYSDYRSPALWIIEPETEIEKDVLETLLQKHPEGKYNIRKRPTKEQKTYTLELTTQ
jgi:thiamine phosphate synthase YjbQ (UPF0047 family)